MTTRLQLRIHWQLRRLAPSPLLGVALLRLCVGLGRAPCFCQRSFAASAMNGRSSRFLGKNRNCLSALNSPAWPGCRR